MSHAHLFLISSRLLAVLLVFQCPSHGGIRVATFNASMNRSSEGRLLTELEAGTSSQMRRIAELIQIVRPDILLINEFDYDEEELGIQLFQENYLSMGQRDNEPIQYPHRYTAPSNTGIPSGFDLDNNGRAVTSPGSGYGEDCHGFGTFPGQYGMAIYSRFPIQEDAVRTFQNFLWKDMPDALLPDDASTEAPDDWYAEEELAVLRLSSKSHWDIPIDVEGTTIHILACHPTPPVFDGSEDRNGHRNHDEIRFWSDYVHPAKSEYIYDDKGNRGGLKEADRFVIMGDMNADPMDGDSKDEAINQLLNNPMVDNSKTPSSAGAKAAAESQGGANRGHKSPAEHDTGDFNDSSTGNLRIDYVLPSKAGLEIESATVFWPESGDPDSRLLSVSDHRMVYVDLEVTGGQLTSTLPDIRIRHTGEQAELTWVVQEEATYQVQYTENLSSDAWIPMPEASVVVNSELKEASVKDSINSDSRFYRVSELRNGG